MTLETMKRWQRTPAGVTCCALLAAWLGPPIVQGQDVKGRTYRMPNRVNAWYGSLDEEPPIEPWCIVDAISLSSCSGSYECGPGVVLPCGETRGGLSLVASGVGLRNVGRGWISVRGAPPDGRVIAAYLIWGTIIRRSSPNPLRSIIFNGTLVHGTSLGETEEPCWAGEADYEMRFETFMTDVKPLLDDEINGEYSVALPDSARSASITDGRSPWMDPPGSIESGFQGEGASLIVLFSHARIAKTGLVAIHMKPHTFFGHETFRLGLPAVLPPAEQIISLRLGGDGQVSDGTTAVASYRTEIRLGDDPDWTLLRGPGSRIDVHSDWVGGDGGTFNLLWDTQLTEFAAGTLEPFSGQGFYELRYSTVQPSTVEQLSPADQPDEIPSDCVVQVATALVFYSWAEEYRSQRAWAARVR